jgi:DNA-binding transcriptional regulator GbsR (MarR family)
MDDKEKKTAKIAPLRSGNKRWSNTREQSSLLYPRAKRDPANVSWIPSDSESPKQKFTELIAQNLKYEGFDEISSRIVGVLFIEPEEMSLEEISIETGYSLSAVSTAMKNLSQFHIVKRFKKPGSKKAFFFLDKNLAAIGAQALRMKYDSVILPSKKMLPDIIEKYERDVSDKNTGELEIVTRYYRQIMKLESIVEKFLDEMENIDTDEE